MIKIYDAVNRDIKELDDVQEGCWISLVHPSNSEITEIANKTKIDPDTLKAALDPEERSRIEIDDDYTMVIVDIPTIEEQSEKELYNTIPLSIFITKDVVITVCIEDTVILKQFAEGRVRDFHTKMKSRFILQILYRTASLYLQYLRIIDKKSDIVENKLHKSTQNRELIELLTLEKSLVYFTTALRSNEAVLEKLLKNEIIKKYPEDTDLLEDVIVENKQAIEMANIYSGILSGMMDAFASVISNNLNVVMKTLALITIVMSIPTMIFSAYGMNVSGKGMPFSSGPYGFLIIVAFSLVLSVIVTFILVRMKLFK